MCETVFFECCYIERRTVVTSGTLCVQSSFRQPIFTAERKCLCTVPYTCTKTRTVQAAAFLHDVPSAVPGSKCVHVGVAT